MEVVETSMEVGEASMEVVAAPMEVVEASMKVVEASNGKFHLLPWKKSKMHQTHRRRNVTCQRTGTRTQRRKQDQKI